MLSETVFARETSIFVEGNWSVGSKETFEIPDPSTGKVIGSIRAGSVEDVERAAKASEKAFETWSKTPSPERAAFLRGFGRGLTKRKEVLVETQMRNSGKPRIEAEIDVDDAIATFDYYAGLAEGLDQSQNAQVHHAGGAHTGRVRHDPIGPVGMIVPWNFPLVTSAWKIAPALAAGCTAVMKTSEMTPFIELVYGDIAQEIGLPAGVLNIITGGAEVGIALTSAPEFRKISFTGSNMIGSRVMQAIAPRCLPVALELGGKSPIIVTEDADVDHAVDCILGGIFYNAGQMCSATSRLIISKAIEPALIDALVAKTNAIRVASPFADRCEMGPITTRAQFDRVMQFLGIAKDSGLTCLTGGHALPETRGLFIAPTIYRNVPHDSPIWRDEIFGPVLATTVADSDEAALDIANDTEFGLVGTVVSGDPDRAAHLADRIQAGQIWVNTPQIVYPDSAWGGFKASGIGRELGPWGLSGYQGVKHITTAA